MSGYETPPGMRLSNVARYFSYIFAMFWHDQECVLTQYHEYYEYLSTQSCQNICKNNVILLFVKKRFYPNMQPACTRIWDTCFENEKSVIVLDSLKYISFCTWTCSGSFKTFKRVCESFNICKHCNWDWYSYLSLEVLEFKHNFFKLFFAKYLITGNTFYISPKNHNREHILFFW